MDWIKDELRVSNYLRIEFRGAGYLNKLILYCKNEKLDFSWKKHLYIENYYIFEVG